MARERIEFRIEVDTAQAERLIRALGGDVRAFGEQVRRVPRQSRRGFAELRASLDRARVSLEGLRETYYALSQIAGPLVDAYRRQAQAQQVLAGTARLLGESQAALAARAQEIGERFRLTTGGASLLTAELAKLEAQAGTSGRSVEAAGRLLDLAAARGYSAEQAVEALRQAMLGLDEGTDKLFGRNPSSLWAEYAASIGTTAGKLTEAQKKYALLFAIFDEGERVRGSLAEWQESAAEQSGAGGGDAPAPERIAVGIDFGHIFRELGGDALDELAAIVLDLSDEDAEAGEWTMGELEEGWNFFAAASLRPMKMLLGFAGNSVSETSRSTGRIVYDPRTRSAWTWAACSSLSPRSARWGRRPRPRRWTSARRSNGTPASPSDASTSATPTTRRARRLD